MKLNVLLERSSFPEEEKNRVRDLMGNPSHPDFDSEVLWAYIYMHQLEPCTQIDAFTQKDVNRRLDAVMKNEAL